MTARSSSPSFRARSPTIRRRTEEERGGGGEDENDSEEILTRKAFSGEATKRYRGTKSSVAETPQQLANKSTQRHNGSMEQSRAHALREDKQIQPVALYRDRPRSGGALLPRQLRGGHLPKLKINLKETNYNKKEEAVARMRRERTVRILEDVISQALREDWGRGQKKKKGTRLVAWPPRNVRFHSSVVYNSSKPASANARKARRVIEIERRPFPKIYCCSCCCLQLEETLQRGLHRV